MYLENFNDDNKGILLRFLLSYIFNSKHHACISPKTSMKSEDMKDDKTTAKIAILLEIIHWYTFSRFLHE
jgi:hypothetical protein